MKKSKNYVATLLLFALMLSLTSCFEKEHTHEYSQWKTVSSASCTEAGQQTRTCSCGQIETKTIAATGHAYGDWMYESDYAYRACNGCGFREFDYSNRNNNEASTEQNGDHNEITNPAYVVTVQVEYPDFDSFLKDCQYLSNNEIIYNGNANTFSVCLIDGINKCDNYTIYIPSRVTSVRISGAVKGTPFQNVKIVVEDRRSDIDIQLNDLMIESATTILESQTYNINVDIYLTGDNCSLMVTEKAANGANGRDKTDFSAEAQSGENGQDGAPAMFINGNCSITCAAEQITVKGGDGGDGGNGGSPTGIHFGAGGNGGDGGNGANAIEGEKYAVAYVTSLCEKKPSFIGGTGGKGGSGGNGNGWESDGGSGRDGTKGIEGCEFIEE